MHHKIAIKDVDPESGFDPNVQENIGTLCKSCHRAFHVSYEHLPYEQFITEVPLEEALARLKTYRDEKDRKRAIEAAKHRKRKQDG
jgi:hypothetical protein